MPETHDERELLPQIAAGDKDAMRRLYEAYHASLSGFLRRRTRDDALVDDVVQETMLQVWKVADQYNGKSSPKTWIFAIANNKLTDRFRKLKRYTVTDDLPEVVDEASDPEAVVQNSQDAARVRHCLSQLKDQQRTAVELAFFQDLKYEEIAEVENAPVGTIKTRIFHAKKLLMRCLGGRD